MFASVIGYQNWRYAKVATWIGTASLLAYFLDDSLGGRNGGTWIGYGLGVAATGLAAWLAWFGVRKRRYGSGTFPLVGWMSAHVYLGVAVILVATLHSGFEFELNMHFISYGLLMVVSVSGVVGLVIYTYAPTAMTSNANGLTTEEMFVEIAEINRDLRQTGSLLSDDINRLIRRSVQKAELGGGFWRLLIGRYRDTHTDEALAEISEQASGFSSAEAEAGRRLVTLLARKVEALQKLRRHIQYKAWMDVWLYVHVPMTIAFLIALIGHVLFIFYF